MNDEIRATVCDFGNLYKAMYRCKRNVMWKGSVAGYVKNGLVNCYKLKKSLENGTYKISPYTEFKVFEPKERDIVSTRIKDRVFQRSLCDNYLYDAVTKSFIYDNGACQYNKGTLFSRNRLECHLQRHFRKYGLNGYVLKCDISNFFGSTSHKVAIQALSDRVDNEWALTKASDVVNSFTQGIDPEVGLGLGSQLTQLNELAVLDKLDHFIKEVLRIKGYVRYMDDFVLMHPDKEYLKYCLSEITKKIQSIGLTLSSKKTQLFPITQPISFLGFSFRLTATGKVVKKIEHKKISHERRKLKGLMRRVELGKMTLHDVDDCYTSYKAHASYGNTHGMLIQMDQYYKNLKRSYNHEKSQKHQKAAPAGTQT